MAVQYQSLKQKALQTHGSLQVLNEKLTLAESLAELKQTLETSSKPVSASTSFADMVKKSQNSFILPSTLSSVAIYPCDKSKSSEETKNIVQQVICAEQMKLKVRAVRKIRNGGVIISTETKSDSAKLKQSVQLATSGLTVDEPHKRKSQIIILGVLATMTEKEVFNQNDGVVIYAKESVKVTVDEPVVQD